MTKFHAKFPHFYAEFGRGALTIGGHVQKLGALGDVRGL